MRISRPQGIAQREAAFSLHAGHDHSTQAKSTQGAQLELSIHCHFDDFCKLQQSTSRNRGAQRAVAQLQAGCTARRRRDAKQR